MKHTVKQLAVLSVAFVSLSAFADAQAGHGKAYRYAHQAQHVRHHVPHRHYRKHHHRPVRHAHYYKPRHVVYRAPVYYQRPAYAKGATIWLDGFGFSIYGH